MLPRQARELANYQDEPQQLPSGALGKDAFLRLGFERRGERSALITLRRRAPLIVQQALYWDEEMPELPCVYIITNSGGILQGDRYAIEIDVAPGAQAHVTTQAATRIHEMDANYAAQTQDIVLGEGAYLEYLPYPVVPFRGSRFMTQTKVTMDPSATLIYSEILMPGRMHYGEGERFAYDLFSSTVRAERPDGNALFTEKFIVDPRQADIRQVGVMGAFDVFANVLVLTPQAHAHSIFDKTESFLDLERGLAAGASRLPNDAGLVYNVLGMDSQTVRAQVREFWGLVRREIVGRNIPKEFLWG